MDTTHNGGRTFHFPILLHKQQIEKLNQIAQAQSRQTTELVREAIDSFLIRQELVQTPSEELSVPERLAKLEGRLVSLIVKTFRSAARAEFFSQTACSTGILCPDETRELNEAADRYAREVLRPKRTLQLTEAAATDPELPPAA